MSKKIAVLVSGRINCNEEYYHDIFSKVFVDNLDVDIFVCHSKTDDKEMVDRFIKLYKPKGIRISDEDYFNIDGYEHSTVNARNMMCMFLNRYYLLEMLRDYVNKNDVIYDIVISTRCDLVFSSRILFTKYERFIENNCVCIPSGEDHDGINDQFAFGNYVTMSAYLEVYNYLRLMLSRGVAFHPETLLQHYLLVLRNIAPMRFSIKYFIHRDL